MAVPLPTNKQDCVKAYFRIMLEVKARFEAIKSIRQSSWPPGLIVEVCQLQMRHICDLVTVGAVIIHGDYRPEIVKDTSPARIFKALERKFASPFPQPATVTYQGATQGGNPKNIFIVANQVPNAMTKDEFITVWAQSGDFLHRLKVTKFFRPDDRFHDALVEIDKNVAKLYALLETHLYGLRTPATEVFVIRLADENGRLEAFFVEFHFDEGGNRRVELRHFDAREPPNQFRAKPPTPGQL